jgi:hypothetical protein
MHVYIESHKTVRISPEGNCILSMPKAFRSAFYQGCIELDLKSCQLAVAAKQWDLPILTAFLANDGDIWQELAGYINRDITEVKGDIKEFVYAAIYGMKKRNLVRKCEESFGNSDLMSHEMIKEVLDARDKHMNEIKRRGGAFNAFGEWIETDFNEFDGWDEDDLEELQLKAERSVLACINQSWEQMLMLSVFESIKKNKNLQLVAWIHDGCIVHIKKDRHRIDSFVKRIQKDLAAKAKELGFHTRLEVTYL